MISLLRLLARKATPARTFIRDESQSKSANRQKRPVKADNRVLGSIGESAAVKYLQKNGYRIIERNHRNRGGEIDIIAEHRGIVTFIEVKTRSPRAWLAPETAVDAGKQARIARTAHIYLEQFRTPSPHRFDVLTVLTDDDHKPTQIRLIKDAFRPGSNPQSLPEHEATC